MSSPLHEGSEESSASQCKMIHHLENLENNKWLEQQSKCKETNVKQIGRDQATVAPKCGASKPVEYLENKLSSDHKTTGNSDYQNQTTNKKDVQLVEGVEYEVCRRSKFKVTGI